MSPVSIGPSAWATPTPVHLSTLPRARWKGRLVSGTGRDCLGQLVLLAQPLQPHIPQRALQAMFSASVSLFKQNALIFLVSRSCGLPSPLQPTEPDSHCSSLISLPWNKTRRTSWLLPSSIFFSHQPTRHRKVHFVICSTLCALRTALVVQPTLVTILGVFASIKSLQVGFL